VSSGPNRLYADLAWTWPIISPPEDYAEEAGAVTGAIRARAQGKVRNLLNLGCGGGHNDAHLKRQFTVTGVDTSEAMLYLARDLNPEIEYLPGDMRSVRLGRTFDAVTIFDSIDYMLTEADLRQTFVTAFEHLRPGGVFVTYAEITRERFRQNRTRASTRSKGDVEITLVENDYDPNPEDTTFESTHVYLIRRGGDLTVEVDRHTMGIFPDSAWHHLLREAGFEVTRSELDVPDQEPVPLWIGLRPD
jgi:SAM-dependent methyltransferase